VVDLATVIGLILGFAMMGGALFVMGSMGHGDVHLAGFIDPPAIMMVIGGGLAVAMVGFPMRQFLSLALVIKKVFHHHTRDLALLIDEIVALAEVARRDGILALEHRAEAVNDPFVALGIQMAVDGTPSEAMEAILRSEIDAMTARHREGKKMLELLGRCGPAFGMIATLLGLVMMLGNLSDPDAIGPSMGVALIGTLYGATMANLICIPFSEKLAVLSGEEVLAKEMALQGILAIQAGDNPRIIQQKLTTYLPPKQRAAFERHAA
jgi:chemotaxis protein MotA